jgi:hypothetical protein
MNPDDHILFAAAAIRLKRAAHRATLAFESFAVTADPDRAGREVEKLIASSRGDTPESDEVLVAGPSADARRLALRRRARRGVVQGQDGRDA